MKVSDSPSLSCRHCRYYTPEGRRGGHCQRLNVMVQSGWRACSVAVPPFVPNWESLEEIMLWQQQAIHAHYQHIEQPEKPSTEEYGLLKAVPPTLKSSSKVTSL